MWMARSYSAVDPARRAAMKRGTIHEIVDAAARAGVHMRRMTHIYRPRRRARRGRR